ncbi:MAG: hypothetical protein ACTSQI_05045 [Candidatus Helarchaeota archaeon]
MKKTSQSLSDNIVIEVDVPTDNFSTWHSLTILSMHHSIYEPSDLTPKSLKNPIQSVCVIIPVNFLTIDRLKLEFDLEEVKEKNLKKVFIRHYGCCNAKVQSIHLPSNLW